MNSKNTDQVCGKEKDIFGTEKLKTAKKQIRRNYAEESFKSDNDRSVFNTGGS